MAFLKQALVFIQPQAKVVAEVGEVAVVEHFLSGLDVHGLDDVDELPPASDH